MVVAADKVKSPKNRLREPLQVVHQTADWALATAFWDKERALMMRWNGTEDRPKGNPVSTGYPTWFVVPSELHWPILATVEDATKRLEAVTWLNGPPLP